MKNAGFFFFFLIGVAVLVVGACAPATQHVVATRTPVLPSPVVTVYSNDAHGVSPSPTGFAVVTPVSPVSPLPTSSPDALSIIYQPLFGAEIRKIPMDDASLGRLVEAGIRLVRYNGVVWSAVEAQQGQWNWDTLASLEAGLKQLAERGIDVILVVRGAPAWAQKIPGRQCGPIREDHLASFAAFMAEMVRRYSVPPYNVRYWELGNEPDVDGRLVAGNSVFGCWGDEDDAFYGGEYYAKMLQTVYPAMKAANPDIRVLNGGLLLDCDPEHPREGKVCVAGRFLEGILRSNGGDYLDAISFHGYPFYVGSLQMDVQHPAWYLRGGVVMGKVHYLQSLMNQYNVSKPLFLTETSLLCPEWASGFCTPPGAAFYDAQADYLVRVLTRSWAGSVDGVIWYQFEGQGWRYSGLTGRNLADPNPAFQAFRFFNEKMDKMAFVEPLNLTPAVIAYKFVSPDEARETWILWSADDEEHYVELPVSIAGVYNAVGGEVPFADHALDISSATYVDIAP